MSAEILETRVRDLSGLTLEDELAVTGEDYMRVMRRIMPQETGTPVSAFNSSI